VEYRRDVFVLRIKGYVLVIVLFINDLRANCTEALKQF